MTACVIVLAVLLVYSVTRNLMAVAQGGFFARISDPRIGGTHMTLLNTMANFGAIWPNLFVFSSVDILSWVRCDDMGSIECSGSASCQPNCVTLVDGYYVVAAVCVIVACLLYTPIANRILALQRINPMVWRREPEMADVSADVETNDDEDEDPITSSQFQWELEDKRISRVMVDSPGKHR